MDLYLLYFDDSGQAIVIEDHPDALDRAPYDRIVKRRSKRPVDAGMAELALKMHGGVMIPAAGMVVPVEAI